MSVSRLASPASPRSAHTGLEDRRRTGEEGGPPRLRSNTGEVPTDTDRPRLRMLYVVGGGPGMAERVDVSDLFAHRLAQLGFRIDWVLRTDEPGPAWGLTLWRDAIAYAVGRPRSGGLPGRIAGKLRDLAADLRTLLLVLRGGYDLVQVRDAFLVAALALAGARISGARFTYWASYPFAECRIEDARTGRARLPVASLLAGHAAKWLLYRVVLPRADRVFVQSARMLEDFAAEGVARESMVAVPMGVGERLLELPRSTPEPDTLLYLGTLNAVRRLDTLVDALALIRRRFPRARLIFVGDGDVPRDREVLARAIDRHGLRKAVEITGWLPAEAALARTARAAVCVSPFFPTPILSSTSPTKLVEYLALGRPVVANVHPEQSLVLAESGAGLCVEWSAEAFADAVCTLFADPERAEAMGQQGRAYVRERRLYGAIAERLAPEYLQLLPTRRVLPEST